MPEKEGAEEKSTKSVVNKKQKQMMGEEGYDIARDEGRVKPSKDKKDATSYPVSDEVKKTQKKNKGPSAFELVKKKYGKAVMKVGKKKVKEELDLTKVAEAFGGYIVNEKLQSLTGNPEEISRKIKKAYSKTKKKQQTKKDADQAAEISQARGKFTKSFVKPSNVEISPEKQSGMARDDVEKQGGRIGDETTTDDGTTATALSGPVKVTRVNPRTLVSNPTGAPVSSKPQPRKPRTIPFKDRKQLDPETQKKVDAVTPPFAT